LVLLPTTSVCTFSYNTKAQYTFIQLLKLSSFSIKFPKGGFRTKKEAEKACQLVITELTEGSYEISNEQFDHYFTRWFESQHRREVAASTYESRSYLMRKHLLPYFESKAINTITAFEIDCLYNDKLDKGYSPKTVKEMHCLLKMGFQKAV